MAAGLPDRRPHAAAVPAPLTVDRPGMAVDQLPNGLGSFYGHLAEGRAQHAPWNSAPLGTRFPAQHPVCSQTRVSYERLPRGARLIYTGLQDAPEAVLTQELTVDPVTGDLVLQQQVHSGQPGVFGIAMSLLNLRPEINWAMPYFGGQSWRAEDGRDLIATLAWARFWNAGFAIGELPGAGSFLVWADDPGLHPKYFRRRNERGVQAVGFEACADAPYDQAEYTAFPWRFNTFAGNWEAAAERYKQWMIAAQHLVPRRQRSSGWIDDVALIWPAAPNLQAMEAMARLFDPKKILLHNWGMLKAFNRRVPEYIPADPHYADLVARAHQLGYRVGAYSSMLLVDQEAFPNIMRQYGLEYSYDGLTRDKPLVAKDWLAEVHPGSSAWREFYSAKMAEVQRTYGVDYLYQDVAGGGLGSSARIEGHTLSQGVVACEEAIRAACRWWRWAASTGPRSMPAAKISGWGASWPGATSGTSGRFPRRSTCIPCCPTY